ncbi:MAG: DUF3089 domain-containing protein [Alphaproteobacteria bacterium]
MGRKIAVALLVFVFMGAVGLFAMERFAGQILFKPKHSFAEQNLPAAPDYTDQTSWAALPGRDDSADILPDGFTAPADDLRQADVFYIYPTVLMSKSTWVADIADPETNMLVEQLPVLGQATAFNGCCRVYVPRYRQATLWTFMANEPDNHQAIDFAYQDIARAFDAFLERVGDDRPIVLAGHSQGTRHLVRLVAEKINDTRVADRVVAVYAIGSGVFQEVTTRGLSDFPVCDSPSQTGCLITWDAVDKAKASGREMGEGLYMWLDGVYQPANDPSLACVNPLTWRAGEAGEKEDHAGMVPLDSAIFSGVFVGRPAPPVGTRAQLGGLMPQSVSATCAAQGLLVDVSGIGVHGKTTMPGGSLHLKDYSLFYKDIFDNAITRVNAFLAAR